MLMNEYKLWVAVEQRADGATRWGPDPYIVLTADKTDNHPRREIQMSAATAKVLVKALNKAIRRAAL